MEKLKQCSTQQDGLSKLNQVLRVLAGQRQPILSPVQWATSSCILSLYESIIALFLVSLKIVCEVL